MTANTDINAAREAIAAELAEAEATAARLDSEIGRLALAVVLNEAPASDLAGAREARAAAAARVAELTAAGVALDEREIAEAEAAAEAKRTADLAEREAALGRRKIASTEAALLVESLAVAVRAAVEDDAVAVAIAKRYDLRPASTQRATVGYDVAVLLGERLHDHVPGQAYQRTDTAEAAAGRLLHQAPVPQNEEVTA